MQYDLYLEGEHVGGNSAIGANQQAWVIGHTFPYPYQGKKRKIAVERLKPDGGRVRVDLVRRGG